VRRGVAERDAGRPVGAHGLLHIGIVPAVAHPNQEIEMRFVYVVLATMVLSACNTMAGLGEDIQRGGQKLENQAEKAKK
jgi:predicted small secreted protein